MSLRLSPISSVEKLALSRTLPISPLVGEMPGRAEGGAKELQRSNSGFLTATKPATCPPVQHCQFRPSHQPSASRCRTTRHCLPDRGR
ncbi:MAG: hypothetical protein EOR78_07735 [Mesorhizobium sp.]|nr:MAG: hypothetical protein EOR49_12880 [Mesorhizobium sp.]RWM45783.1 MAG: hypothetical protein EOR76_20545 [Mesorhizobium sp.]RWM57880.1 MAG: hypothetical protein EOR78_07735 [Mesorhizobium sp.]RWM59229.1 MAG: hypothetical protein EOR79_10475 [Mesorhizobium sp.]RWM97565.1 MAG: hypothetical protein EOR85_20815 [Mesorhizobium sp.]